MSQFGSALDPQEEENRYEAILALADLLVRHYSLSELFHQLAQRLQRVAEFQLLHFSLHDPKENVMRRHLWEGEWPHDPGSRSAGGLGERSCAGEPNAVADPRSADR